MDLSLHLLCWADFGDACSFSVSVFPPGFLGATAEGFQFAFVGVEIFPAHALGIGRPALVAAGITAMDTAFDENLACGLPRPRGELGQWVLVVDLKPQMAQP